MSDARKVSKMGMLARNLGFEHPSLMPEGQTRSRSGSADSAMADEQDTVDWQQPQPGAKTKRRSRSHSRAGSSSDVEGGEERSRSRSRSRSRGNSVDLSDVPVRTDGVLGSGLAGHKVQVTLPAAPQLVRRWSQSTHNAFHDFLSSKGGEPSVNLQREAAGYLSMAAELCATQRITEAHKTRVKKLVAKGNLAQTGRELFWLVLGEQAAALTPEASDTLAAPPEDGAKLGGASASETGNGADGVRSKRPSGARGGGKGGVTSGRKGTVVQVQKRTDIKGNEMDQLQNPFFARRVSGATEGGAAGGDGPGALMLAPRARMQDSDGDLGDGGGDEPRDSEQIELKGLDSVTRSPRTRAATVSSMSMYNKSSGIKKKVSVSNRGAGDTGGGEARDRSASTANASEGRARGNSASRMPLDQLQQLSRQQSSGSPMYRTGEVESLLTSVMRAGAKTWKLSQMQLNAKKVQLFKMSEDAPSADERTVVKTRKEFELRNVDQLRLLNQDEAGGFYGFQFTFKGSGQRPLLIRLPTEAERDRWHSALQNNLDLLWSFH